MYSERNYTLVLQEMILTLPNLEDKDIYIL